MQIDFHHTATYVAARLGGLDHDDASVVATAAEYVDGATQSGVIRFEDGSAYSRQSSAHKALDYRNFGGLAQSRVWIPFHFLPGNGGLPAGEVPAGGRVAQLVTRPDSPPARDMVRMAIEERRRPWGLHRLGITMHVYADTWAHQGFVGINHKINDATELSDVAGTEAADVLGRLAGWFIGASLPLGHGTVLSLPDRPWIRWQYRNGLGELIVRNNPEDYLSAADAMCRAVQRFVRGDPYADVGGLPPFDADKIWALIQQPGETDERHQRWIAAIADGTFSFGPAQVAYVHDGPGSWKHDALGTNDVQSELIFRPEFAHSHYKRFHDALQQHRFDVLHDILPRYGIIAD